MPPLKLVTDNTQNQSERTPENLRDQTLGFIRDAIMSGRFEAGQKLKERELCEITGASRSVLREALANLEAKRLVERVSNRGYTVARLGVNSIREIFELRQSVETLATELFTERASDHELEQINEAYSDFIKAIDKNDLAGVRAAKDKFFSVLFTGCRNKEIQIALENVIDRISYLRSKLIDNDDRRKASIEEMRVFCTALVNRDKIAARQSCLLHLKNAQEALLQQISNNELKI